MCTSYNSVYAATASLTVSLRPYCSFRSQHRIHADVMRSRGATSRLAGIAGHYITLVR